jgi:hypothetical protein
LLELVLAFLPMAAREKNKKNVSGTGWGAFLKGLGK